MSEPDTTHDEGVADALAKLDDLDLSAPPEELLADLTAVHDHLAERLRAAES